MATIVASATGGNYSSTAAWVGGVVPGINDVVQLNGTSGNITLDASATNLCYSFDCTGYTGTLTLTAAQTFTVSGNLFKLVSGMTFTITGTTGGIYFTDAAADTVNIYTGGLTMPAVNFGQGLTTSSATWNLMDSWTFPNTAMTHTTGTLTTNGVTMTGNTMQAGGNNVRTMNLGASVITMTSSTFGWNFSNSTSATLNPGTSSITTVAGSGFQGGNLVYYDLTMTGAGSPQLAGINTFHNFTRTGSAVTTDGLVVNNQQTVTGTLTLTGNSSVNRLWITSFSYFGATFVANGTTVLNNVDFQTVIGGGTSAPWSGTNVGNGGGNGAGITFSTPKNVYWIGGTGTLTDPTHLAATSGGTGSTAFPLPQDTIIFDANSFPSTAQTVTTASTRMLPGMDFSAATNSPTLSSASSQSTVGKLVLSSAMTTSGASTISFAGTTSTINTNGTTVNFPVTVAGGLQLLSNVTMGVTLTLTHTSGTLDLNGFTLAPGKFVANGTTARTITFGSGTLSLTGTGTILNVSTMTGYTVNRGTGTIQFTNVTSTAKTLSFGGGNWPSVVTPASNLSTTVITAPTATTFDNWTFGAASTYSFGAGQTFIFKGFNATGTAGNLVTFISGTAGTAAIFSYITPGIPTVAYASIKDNNPVQTGIWFAGANSTAVSNTGNWLFSKGTGAVFSAGMGFAGTEPKATSKTLVAGMTLQGLKNIWLFRTLGGGLSFLGQLASQASHNKLVGGSLGFLGTFARQVFYNRAVSGSLSFLGSLARQLTLSRQVTASLSFLGNLGTQIIHIGATPSSSSLGFIGNLIINASTRQKVAQLASNLGFVGVLSKSVARGVASTLTSSALFLSLQNNTRAGLSFIGGLGYRVGKRVTSSVSFGGSLTSSSAIKNVQINSTLSFGERQVSTGEQYEIGNTIYGNNVMGQMPSTTGSPAGFLAINYIKSKGLYFVGNLVAQKVHNQIRVWNGSAWIVKQTFNVWDGSQWVPHIASVWDGTNWVLN